MSSQRFQPPREPLQNWQVSWFNDDQRFDDTKIKWWFWERSPADRLQPLLGWVFKRSNGTVRDVGALFTDLWWAKLGVGDDDDWHFAHPLGRGGFGAVAMFEKRDNSNLDLMDQLAVKTTQAKRNMAVDPDRIDLSLEAALMAQTNDIHEDGMLSLRQFKYYDEDQQWKYYFEYCPYGDLERLRVRYKAYGRALPELFLWHLFYWLAKTMREYSEYNDWLYSTPDKWGDTIPSGYLLHCDIKTANILLGVPDPNDGDSVCLYPIPRVADLGLAEIQTKANRLNTAANLTKGTPGWFPPEIRWKSMSQHTAFYPFGNRPNPNLGDQFRKARHKITSEANIWAVGAVMFGMASLKEIDFLDKVVEHYLGEKDPLPEQFSNILKDSDFNQHMPQYSQDLIDLIKSCTSMKPQDRPMEETLVNLCFNRYQAHLEVLRQQEGVVAGEPGTHERLQTAVDTLPQYRLYYRENEIDRATDNYRYHHSGRSSNWWTNMFCADFPWLPPHWGRLWPAVMPRNTATPRYWPDGFKDGMRQVRAEVAAERDQGGQPTSNNAPPPTIVANPQPAIQNQQPQPQPPPPNQRPLPPLPQQNPQPPRWNAGLLTNPLLGMIPPTPPAPRPLFAQPVFPAPSPPPVQQSPRSPASSPLTSQPNQHLPPPPQSVVPDSAAHGQDPGLGLGQQGQQAQGFSDGLVQGGAGLVGAVRRSRRLNNNRYSPYFIPRPEGR